MEHPTPKQAAEAVRDACLRAALDGYERAGLGGLCEEGRWEMVVDSIKSLDLDAVLASLPEASGVPDHVSARSASSA